MKKVMVLLIMALVISPLLLCIPKAQAAADWKQYDQNKLSISSYDANSIKRSGDVVHVTLLNKNTPLGTSSILPSQKVDYYIRLVEINCRNKTFFQKRIILYRADGSKIDDVSFDEPGLPPDKPYAIHPGSNEDLLYRIICGF